MENKRQLKILIVDDEEGIIDITLKIFRKKGYIAFGVTDGIAAVDIYQKERPDISLIDVHMPFSPIDGIETLKRIKDINKNALCLMVTRITERDKIEAAEQLGAEAYLLKPLEFEELDKVITEMVKSNFNQP